MREEEVASLADGALKDLRRRVDRHTRIGMVGRPDRNNAAVYDDLLQRLSFCLPLAVLSAGPLPPWLHLTSGQLWVDVSSSVAAGAAERRVALDATGQYGVVKRLLVALAGSWIVDGALDGGAMSMIQDALARTEEPGRAFSILCMSSDAYEPLRTVLLSSRASDAPERVHACDASNLSSYVTSLEAAFHAPR